MGIRISNDAISDNDVIASIIRAAFGIDDNAVEGTCPSRVQQLRRSSDVAVLNPYVGHCRWNRHIRFARALLSRLRAQVADTLPLEAALHVLVDKIVPGLDTGDLVQDARRASTALSAILASAPVADERAAFEAWATAIAEKYDVTRNGDHYMEPYTEWVWEAWQARAALASAPVAPQACPTDVCQAGQQDGVLCANNDCDRANGVRPPMCRIPGVREDVLRRAAERMTNAPVADERGKPKMPAPMRAGDCYPDFMVQPVGTAEIYAEVIESWARQDERARASAPVAGEAQKPVAWMLIGRLKNSEPKFTLSDPAGIYESVYAPLYAAPQASAEDVHNAALEALEAARRFIRNGIELGYIRMPDAGTPDPAHRTPGLIDAAIRALKQPQADKDGGQQRAGDAERWRWATATDENAQMLYTIVQAYGGDQKKINERADFYRAALSATQAEQGDTREA